jgi:phosphatidate cytidylyltransferase
LAEQSELVRRSLTGILIVVFTLLPVILSPWTLLGWLCIIHLIGMIEFFRLQGKLKTLDYGVAAVTTGWLAFAGWNTMSSHPIAFTLLLLPIIFCVFVLLHMIRNQDTASISAKGTQYFASGLYITIALWTGTLFMSDAYDYRLLLIPIFLIWINDSGAYLVGSRIGKNKIATAISPGKTIEGTLGGTVVTLILAFILTQVWKEIPPGYIWFLGILTPLFSLAGDLWESALKRAAGVKDSGRILPGHGGMLDRYDSFLFVLPLAATGYFIFVS